MRNLYLSFILLFSVFSGIAQQVVSLGGQTLNMSLDTNDISLRSTPTTVQLPWIISAPNVKKDVEALQVEIYDTIAKKWNAVGSPLLPTRTEGDPVSDGGYYYSSMGPSKINGKGNKLFVAYGERIYWPSKPGVPSHYTNQIIIKKLDTDWVSTDSFEIASVSGSGLQAFEIAPDQSGHLLYTQSNKLYYRKLSSAGKRGNEIQVSTENIFNAKISFDATGTPIILYTSLVGTEYTAIALKWNGTAWATMNQKQVPYMNGDNTSPIAFDKDGQPLVITGNNTGGFFLAKLVNNAWVTIGPAITLPTSKYYMLAERNFTITVDRKGTPYVAYRYFPSYISDPSMFFDSGQILKLVDNNWIYFASLAQSSGSGNNMNVIDLLSNKFDNTIYSLETSTLSSSGDLKAYKQSDNISMPSLILSSISSKKRNDPAFQFYATTNSSSPIFYGSNNYSLILISNGNTATINANPDTKDSTKLYASVGSNRNYYYAYTDQQIVIFPSGTTLAKIASMVPGEGSVGEEIIITGQSFTGATSVEFSSQTSVVRLANEESVLFTVIDDNTIKATVPEGAVTGRIKVTTPKGIVYSSEVFTVEKTTGIEDQPLDRVESISISPNPCTNVLRLRGNTENITSYTILDSFGGIVMTANKTIDIISIESLQTGVYFLKITSAKNVSTFKFIKE